MNADAEGDGEPPAPPAFVPPLPLRPVPFIMPWLPLMPVAVKMSWPSGE